MAYGDFKAVSKLGSHKR